MKIMKMLISALIFLAGMILIGTSLTAGISPLIHSPFFGLKGLNIDLIGIYVLVFVGLVSGAILLATSQIMQFEFDIFES